ncbi:MAG: hypothetical protein WC872_03280 [Candidatus Absconditabacterales bacterium]|jgi:hypothetical protein
MKNYSNSYVKKNSTNQLLSSLFYLTIGIIFILFSFFVFYLQNKEKDEIIIGSIMLLSGATCIISGAKNIKKI